MSDSFFVIRILDKIGQIAHVKGLIDATVVPAEAEISKVHTKSPSEAALTAAKVRPLTVLANEIPFAITSAPNNGLLRTEKFPNIHRAEAHPDHGKTALDAQTWIQDDPVGSKWAGEALSVYIVAATRA